MPSQCYVKGCNRNRKDDKEHSFFRLPKNPKIRQQWLEFAGMTEVLVHMRICSDHFEKQCVWKQYPRPLLIRDAIPTLRKPVLDAKPIEKYHGSKMELQRASQQANCLTMNRQKSRKVTGIDVSPNKPAANKRAFVHIHSEYPLLYKLPE